MAKKLIKPPSYVEEGILLPPVVPEIREWPIAQLLRNTEGFVNEVSEEAVSQLLRNVGNTSSRLHDIIASTMYSERLRMREDPWKIDPPDEKKFWSDIKSKLVQTEQEVDDPELALRRDHSLLEQIVDRYAHEIASEFRPATYHFAKRALPLFFSTLLNASLGKTLRSVWHHRYGLQEKVHLRGEIDAIRNLATKGTIILVPTHFSNVDSIIVGWSLHALGLPAFIYGAGLNLFNNRILAYMMSRIGAYKVDRRKRNEIYRETLFAYSRRAIMHNVHSLFFPGGTRSRNGAIEKNLKLGLLGTTIEAQRRNLLPGGSQRKIFIVPMVMSYHFVLEANSLIRQHLSRTGKEQYYIMDDEFASYRKFLNFAWKTFSSTSDIALNFGRPIDIFGNFVDENGQSFDLQGRPIDIRAYFQTRGEFREDEQRDAVYTQMLGERIVERYHAEHMLFSSHVVAFTAFEMFQKRFPQFDLFELLRIPEEDRSLDLNAFYDVFERVITAVRELRNRSKVFLAPHFEASVRDIVAHGIKNIGLFHPKRPIRFEGESQLVTENMNLLYYYHNRLLGYDLERLI